MEKEKGVREVRTPWNALPGERIGKDYLGRRVPGGSNRPAALVALRARAAPVAALSAAMAPAAVAVGAVTPAVLALGALREAFAPLRWAVVAEALGAAAVPASSAVAPAVPLAIAVALACGAGLPPDLRFGGLAPSKEALQPAEESLWRRRCCRGVVAIRALLVPRTLLVIGLVARIARLAPVRVMAGLAPLVAGFAPLAPWCALRVFAAVGAE
jgi:hypothetical protein